MCRVSLGRRPGLIAAAENPIEISAQHGRVDRRQVRNVHAAQDALEKPLALENVTYTVELPRSEMSQPEFFQRLVEATGCGILLDVTNVHINATNHGFDPHEFLDLMPLERAVHIHLAGGYFEDDYLVDSHSRSVDEETWDLLQSVAARPTARGV